MPNRTGIDKRGESERRYGQTASDEGVHEAHAPRENTYQKESEGGRKSASIHGRDTDDLGKSEEQKAPDNTTGGGTPSRKVAETPTGRRNEEGA